ncbi:DNA repair-scaffolding protein [Galemys pyrenaicus]|uniref:DNA repair-scaffolding protein n=1 Tax=Galemys pyrenaicus TaxID=202257 RepID=A0A8J5ZXL6_GALPY|nr:DNA repair-scaffolding protein [Galemys pyrenaicus]
MGPLLKLLWLKSVGRVPGQSRLSEGGGDLSREKEIGIQNTYPFQERVRLSSEEQVLRQWWQLLPSLNHGSEATTCKSTNDVTDITWSSSASDLSDEDKTLCKSQTDGLQFIDWEIDSDKEDANGCNAFKDSDSVVEISDCASGASSQSLASDEKLSELHKVRMHC